MATQSEMKQLVAEKVESELRFIWQEKEVELGAQYPFGESSLDDHQPLQ